MHAVLRYVSTVEIFVIRFYLIIVNGDTECASTGEW